MKRVLWTLLLAVSAMVLSSAKLAGAPADPAPLEMKLDRGWRFCAGDDPAFAAPAFDDSSWRTIEVPGFWKQSGFPDADGIGWYRTRVSLRHLVFGPVELVLEGVSSCDKTYFNGVQIGETGDFSDDRSGGKYVTRIYDVPPEVLRKGENVVAIRVSPGRDSSGGGLIRPAVLRFLPVSRALAVTNRVERFYFRKGDLFDFYIQVRNRTAIPQEALLGCTVCDFSGGVIGIRAWPVKLGGGERADYGFAVTLPENGIFTVRSSLTEDGTASNGGLAETKVAVLPSFDSAERPDPRFGAGAQLSWCDRATMLATLDLMHRAGLGSVCTDFAWDELEPSLGKFTFERTDLIVDEAERRSLSVWPVVSGVPSWAVVRQSRNRLSAVPDASAWKTFLKTVFSRYRERIPVWEIGREPNLGRYSTKVYGELFSAALSAAAEAGEPPPRVIVGGLSSSGSRKYGMLSAGDYLDLLYRSTSGIAGVACHPYVEELKENSLIENSFRDSFRPIREAMKSHGDCSGLYMTGYASSVHPEKGYSELDQARFLVVATITGMVGDWVQGFFWSDFRNAGVNPQDSAMNSGLVNWDFSPKTALVAYSTLIDRLRFMKFKRQLLDGSDATAYVFENGSRQVVVAWTSFGPRTIHLPGASEVVDMVGRPELVTGENIEISLLPKYITIRK